MLDGDTKRRIDAARDLLVGKVPDPKSQVEQITIALIYKFMDDIDAQSEEWGGSRSFFAGDFARYGWTKLLRGGLGGHPMRDLYKESLEKMPENLGIPSLFRNIFKDAHLPYSDPETLRAFLKIIDEFQYDHSERLGDAFEYLLAVLGAQGDAGQFRTPRHIIDFIVNILDPQKHETILDPACGTAGFLISSYKHILKTNADDKGNSTLTPDDKGSLAANFQGYDISPDMVRLSLVNMYLHEFVAPQIYEYDTLTSEERWHKRFDVILANPPFMSPKGGIRPHSRFSVQSKRSEVLFVDYIAEHLTANGRAGIIVPEGIIFQSQTAYKQLRKLLVEKHLAAVISLPAGVFQPYSGVKTSILILDNALARRRQSIAFFKVESDGYDLGAQRRPIEQNDLPQIAQAAKEWQVMNTDELEKETKFSSFILPKLLRQGVALIVKKSAIAATEDYNLSQERYKQTTRIQSKYPMVKLGEVCEIRKGTAITRKEVVKGSIPVIAGGQSPSTYHNVANRTGETITVSASGYAGYVNYFNEPIFASDCLTIKPKDERVLIAFVFRVLKFKQADIYKLQVGSGQRHVYAKDLALLEIPLPPLEVQQELVHEINSYQRIIDGARQVVQNYRPTLPINPNWPLVQLGEIATVQAGNSAPQGRQYFENGKFPFIRTADVGALHRSDNFKRTKDKVNSKAVQEKRLRLFPSGTILFPKSGASTFLNHRVLMAEPAYVASHLACILCDETQASAKYVYYQLCKIDARKLTADQNYPSLRASAIKSITIPLPSLKTQQSIVEEIEAEQSLINANRELANRMKKKIQASISRIWNDKRQANSKQKKA